MWARAHSHTWQPPTCHQLSTAGAQCATECAPCFLLGNSNATHPQAAPPPATAAAHETRAELRELSLQRAKTVCCWPVDWWRECHTQEERESFEGNPTQAHQCTNLDGWCTDECIFFVRSCPCANQGGYHRLTIFFLFLSPFRIFLCFFCGTLFFFFFFFASPLTPLSLAYI